MIVEVESNDNCEASVFARFKEAGPARPVAQDYRLERRCTVAYVPGIRPTC
jgi:hypothetical protein